MSIFRLNHAVLYVRDLAESVAFYRDVLGFDYIEGGDVHRGAAFLRAPGSANDHDLGLFELGSHAADSGAGKTSVGLYHLAWEVDTLGDLERPPGPPPAPSNGSPAASPRPARSSARPTTAPRSRCTPRIPAGSSSRSSGSSRAT